MSEDLQFLLALVLNGASIGLMYSLIALGFVLVYKATDAINFAQGEFVMLAGLIVAVTLAFEGMPLVAAVVIVLAVMIAFGFGLERVVLRPLLGRPVVAVIMATIGLAAVLRGLGPVIFGSETRALTLPIGDEPIVLGPASLPPIQVLGAVVAIVLVKLVRTLFTLAKVSEAWPENVVNGAALVIAVAFSSVQLSAQTATEYNDKDKAKLAAIAQRPDVIKHIADTWDERRREDMQYAFNINQSAKLAELSGTALAEFRQKYGELYNNTILLRYVN